MELPRQPGIVELPESSLRGETAYGRYASLAITATS